MKCPLTSTPSQNLHTDACYKVSLNVIWYTINLARYVFISLFVIKASISDSLMLKFVYGNAVKPHTQPNY